jgi:flagellar motor switch protein FliN/FliY
MVGGIKPANQKALAMDDDLRNGTGQVTSDSSAAGPSNLDAILSIPVKVQVILGSASMPVSALMKLGRGAIVPLDQRTGDPVNIVVNGRVIARGEVVVVDEESSRFGVSLVEIISSSNDERAP